MNADRLNLFIFSGELSADMYGGNLISALKKHHPHISVTGVGGPKIRSEGIYNVLNMEDFQVMGFSDVLRALPRLWKQFRKVRDHILEAKPGMAIFVDSPSFSLRMAKALRKKGYKGKIVQYISPTVWAWGKQRVKEMEKSFDLLLTIYPFENEYFSESLLKTIYVGHPLQEIVKNHIYDVNWKKNVGINPLDSVIALFPGSREGEIQRNFPILLQTAQLIHKQYPDSVFGISCSDENQLQVMHKMMKDLPQTDLEMVFIPKKYSYELMKDARSAIAKSGTVTLELAFHKCPTVVFYELTKMNKLIAKYILKINLPFYCIVNILGKKKIFSELIENGCTPELLFQHFCNIHQDSVQRSDCKSDCLSVQSLFHHHNASESAANAIMALV